MRSLTILQVTPPAATPNSSLVLASPVEPILLAEKVLSVFSPAGLGEALEEAGLTKSDIRALSRHMGLPSWDKPAFACLSSRFPYGTAITPERVGQVGRAEDALRGLGFRVLRVRYHDTVARLELGPEEFALATGPLRDEVCRLVRESGFVYVALDLQGYRTGAMNEAV